jgi:hypothetical protein
MILTEDILGNKRLFMMIMMSIMMFMAMKGC